jgi:inosine-uridine nucleoside N-ribohydrolase
VKSVDEYTKEELLQKLCEQTLEILDDLNSRMIEMEECYLNYSKDKYMVHDLKTIYYALERELEQGRATFI